ncbi:MAG: alpha-ketoglutarate-dependent dioxygenase AlkB [Bacteroidota bacterium]
MIPHSSRNLLPCDGEVFYFPEFYSLEESAGIYRELLDHIEWEEKAIRIFGREVMQPRKIAWYGDPGISYTYSNLTQVTRPWTSSLLEMKRRLEEFTGKTFNSVLLNLYRSDRDSMGWHSDNEKELGKDPYIASVSFGHPRIFQLKHNDRPLKSSLLLEDGSLLIMSGATQHFWKHQLPKRRALCGPRINLTFRLIAGDKA